MQDQNNQTNGCPQPPRRLVSDRVLLKKTEETQAWDTRRTNKMKERFPTPVDRQPMPTLNLVAPVQPSINISRFVEKPL